MTIYRDGQAIELTGKELFEAYEEALDGYYMDDIGNELREQYDIEPCTDNSEIDLKEIAKELQYLLDRHDTYHDIYWDAVDTAIDKYLKEKGIR